MLTKRVIPCLDMKDGRVVKGISFKNLQDAGHPAELAAFYDNQGADEIVLLDISASHEHRQTLIEVVQQTSEQLFIPLMVGGGIRTIKDIRSILLNGADKIAINTAAVMEPELLHEASAMFGSQCIVASIDIKRVYVQNEEDVPDKVVIDTSIGKCWWNVYIYGGRKSVGIDAIKWAEMVAALGAGEIMASSLDFDGKQQGYDLDFLRIVSERTRIPLIASSGAGNPQHMLDALKIGKADAVLAASIFHYGTYTIQEIKQYLSSHNIPMRY